MAQSSQRKEPPQNPGRFNAVDEEKRRRLEAGYTLALEFDVSDMPASGITQTQLNELLHDPNRWTWLAGHPLTFAQTQAYARLAWTRSHWRASTSFPSTPEVRPASEKLRRAGQRIAWARAQLQMLKQNDIKGSEGAQWLGHQNKVDRVAIACAALSLNPELLPGFLQQVMPAGTRQNRALAHHPYSWQPLVFMKFGIGKKEFSAMQAAEWCLMAMPDRCEHEDGAKSMNGFTQTAATLHSYFMLLETQGFLRGVPMGSHETRLFRPMFDSVAQLHGLLSEQASAS